MTHTSMILNKTIFIQVPTAARWAIPGFFEFLGPNSDAAGFFCVSGIRRRVTGSMVADISRRRGGLETPGINRPAMWRRISEK
jgi:hypothetical protein